MLTLLIAFTAVFSFAGTPDIQTGMWQIDSEIKMDGKKYDPQAEIKKALEAVPEAQRAQVKSMMKSMMDKQGMKFGENFNQICITKEMLKKGHIAPDTDQDCEHNLKEMSSKSYQMSFKCEDGTKGNGKVSILNSKKYKGEMDVKSADGKNVEVSYTGKYVKSSCK